jgi:hypothetical protein
MLPYLLLGAALMLVLLGLGIAIIMPSADRWSKHFFSTYFVVLTVYILISLLEGVSAFDHVRNPYIDEYAYLESLLASVLIIMISVYIVHCCGENWRKAPLFRAVLVLWIAYFLMLDYQLVSHQVYEYTNTNEFVRGPLYVPLLALPEMMLILILIYVNRRRKKLTTKHYYAFLVGLIPMTIALTIHFFQSVFLLFGVGVAICALSMFGLIIFDQIDQNMRQQQEISRQRNSIMLLQMRPHFIYNTMMTIYYLCKQDPDLAQRVTLDFTTYLRKNFTAIGSVDLIPFTEELEHTRAYLAVEQAQFDDRLFVDYDTPHVNFRLPPLTLQPIVENSVKHGMDPDAEPLHIFIRTHQTATSSVITVEDDGTGFVRSSDNEPHIALRNIQQRLATMCNGEMEILPRDGGGTVVEVTIPRQDR